MNNVKILIIDGHPVYYQKTVGFLKGLTLKDITTASSGQEGLKKVDMLRPDLIMMSAMLPDFDGVDICREIRAIKDYTPKIIVQIGVFYEEKDIDDLYQSGANKVVLRKEKDFLSLEKAIDELLFSKSGSRQS